MLETLKELQKLSFAQARYHLQIRLWSVLTIHSNKTEATPKLSPQNIIIPELSVAISTLQCAPLQTLSGESEMTNLILWNSAQRSPARCAKQQAPAPRVPLHVSPRARPAALWLIAESYQRPGSALICARYRAKYADLISMAPAGAAWLTADRRKVHSSACPTHVVACLFTPPANQRSGNAGGKAWPTDHASHGALVYSCGGFADRQHRPDEHSTWNKAATMPQYRQQRVHRGIDGMERRDAGVAFCCLPTGCERVYEEPIILEDPGDAVKVFCNNEVCHMGTWMHGDCFATWEQHVLAYLRSCGRARSWSEKQRLQNLWTKKGYDLAYKACDCKCGKGHLRKDLDYLPPPRSDERKPRRVKHKSGGGMAAKPMPLALKTPTGGAGLIPAVCVPGMNPHRDIRPQLRVRTSSFGSTGSSPPSSAGTPPLTPGGATTPGKKNNKTFEFFADATQAAAGNIFKRRMDFSAFSCLPRHQQNPYHIKMEDEGPYGNDETRCFVLANLSTNLVSF